MKFYMDKRKLPEDSKAKIVALFDRGLSCTRIGKETGHDRYVVARVVEEYGRAVKARTRGRLVLDTFEDMVAHYARKRGERDLRSRAWTARNPDRIREREKVRRAAKVGKYGVDNPLLKIRKNMRMRLYKFTRGRGFRGKSAVLGCTGEQLRAHLSAQFTEGMAWLNYGSLWSVDHIIPLAMFDLTKDAHVRVAGHYLNTQPLGAIANKRKSAKVPLEIPAALAELAAPIAEELKWPE